MSKFIIYLISLIIGFVGCALIFDDTSKEVGAIIIYSQIIYWLSEGKNDTQ